MTKLSKSGRAIRSAVESSNGRIGGPDTVSIIASKTSLPPRTVAEELDRIKSHQDFDVEFSDGRVQGVSYKGRTPRRRHHYDRTERSAQAKREDSFAKGQSAYLRDDQCGPVTVTRMTRPDSIEKFTYVKGEPYHETLNTCLQVLRAMADEDGVGADLSVRAVLLEMIEGMTESAVKRAMKHLSGMDLYTTRMTALRKSTYEVNLTRVVTAEMVTEFRQAAANTTREVSRQASGSPAVTNPGTNEVGQLLVLVEHLESVIAEQKRSIETRDDALVKIDKCLSETTVALEAGQREITSLQEQVTDLERELEESRHHKPDPRVAEILQRHGIT